MKRAICCVIFMYVYTVGLGPIQLTNSVLFSAKNKRIGIFLLRKVINQIGFIDVISDFFHGHYNNYGPNASNNCAVEFCAREANDCGAPRVYRDVEWHSVKLILIIGFFFKRI